MSKLSFYNYLVFSLYALHIVISVFVFKKEWFSKVKSKRISLSVAQIPGVLIALFFTPGLCCVNFINPFYVSGQLLAFWLPIFLLMLRRKKATNFDLLFVYLAFPINHVLLGPISALLMTELYKVVRYAL